MFELQKSQVHQRRSTLVRAGCFAYLQAGLQHRQGSRMRYGKGAKSSHRNMTNSRLAGQFHRYRGARGDGLRSEFLPHTREGSPLLKICTTT
jgi:hypothetical protein